MTKIYALHGFLGRPNDWQKCLPSSVAVDLFKAPIQSYVEWAKQFNDSVTPDSTLVGYSLGGRLALHALIQNPKLWKAAVIISANPGLNCEEEKLKRIVHDKKWAKRFLNDPWDRLMSDWNNQPVFSGDKVKPERNEKDFDRAILSSALEQWSLGKQNYLVPTIKALPMPIFWITGENDPNAARGLNFTNSKSREWIVPSIGHRVPWEHEAVFQTQLQQFLGEMKC